MFERMLDKSRKPDKAETREYIGEDSYKRLCQFESALSEQYQLSEELCLSFGNHYGWGYKLSHKSIHLCYAFSEKGVFTITVQIGDRQMPKAEQIIAEMSSKTRELWANRYPCGDIGGWIHYCALEDEELAEAISLVNAKRASKQNIIQQAGSPCQTVSPGREKVKPGR